MQVIILSDELFDSWSNKKRSPNCLGVFCFGLGFFLEKWWLLGVFCCVLFVTLLVGLGFFVSLVWFRLGFLLVWGFFVEGEAFCEHS